MRSIELFAGAGGLALGVENAGFKHVAVIEWDKHACSTIRANGSMTAQMASAWPVHQVDVRDFEFAHFRDNVQLVSGGPPCQPFSIGGKHRGQHDRRDMFPEAVRVVREVRPLAFVFENVRGLLRRSFAKYFQYILLQLQHPEVQKQGGEQWPEHLRRLEKHHTKGNYRGLYYRTVFSLLNAADFGVPQRRERVAIVGFRSDVCENWCFPNPTHSEDALLREQWVTSEYWERHKIAKKHRPSQPAGIEQRLGQLKFYADFQPWRTVRDALCGLPEPSIRPNLKYQNHTLQPGARTYTGHTGSPFDEPAKTLKAGDHGVPGGENMIAYPDGSVRYFTVRESARLQTFPDWYLFNGSWTENMRQIGNAVPVRLAEIVGLSVKESLIKHSFRVSDTKE
ncbi:MAG: DNA cytosine methyltransferase [bacterium]|nr:DNA cytosine methyltransferase [bacterium]